MQHAIFAHFYNIHTFTNFPVLLKIWQNYRRNLRQLEERLEKDVFKLKVGDELFDGSKITAFLLI